MNEWTELQNGLRYKRQEYAGNWQNGEYLRFQYYDSEKMFSFDATAIETDYNSSDTEHRVYMVMAEDYFAASLVKWEHQEGETEYWLKVAEAATVKVRISKRVFQAILSTIREHQDGLGHRDAVRGGQE